VFCEIAVLQLAELPRIPFAPGRFVWRRAEADAAWAHPARPLLEAADAEWLVGEAQSNLIASTGIGGGIAPVGFGLQRHASRDAGVAGRARTRRRVPAPVTRHIRALAESCGVGFGDTNGHGA
jgi:hypothetical protein